MCTSVKSQKHLIEKKILLRKKTVGKTLKTQEVTNVLNLWRFLPNLKNLIAEFFGSFDGENV